MTKILCAIVVLVLVGSVALPCYAIDTRDIGVFAVVKQSKLPNVGDQIIGTAFLIDHNPPLILTAAHVLAALDLAKDDDRIVIRLDIYVPVRNGKRLIKRYVELEVVAEGYDFRGASGKETADDWAVLQVRNKRHLTLFRLFTPLVFPLNQDADSITKLPGGSTFEYGYPIPLKPGSGGPDRRRRTPVTLDKNPNEENLWPVNGTVMPGNSGGPCVTEGGLRPELLGIVVGQDIDDAARFHIINPPYMFIEDLVEKLPINERVDALLRYLFGPDQLDDSDRDRLVLEMHVALQHFDGIDHWQFLHYLCRFADNRPKDVMEFLLDYYQGLLSGRFLRKLYSCSPASLAHAIEISTDRTLALLGEVDPQQLSGMLAIVEWTTKYTLTQPADIAVASKELSRLYAVAAYAATIKADRSFAVQTFLLAYELDPSNPELRLVSALLDEQLPLIQRESLTAHYLTFAAPPDTNRVFIKPRGAYSTLLISEIWANDPEAESTSVGFSDISFSHARWSEIERLGSLQYAELLADTVQRFESYLVDD